MVGDDVAGQPYAVLTTTSLESPQGVLAAQLFCNPVGMQCVCGSFRFRVAAQLLDAFRGTGTLPDADQPESIETPICQTDQFFLRNVCQGGDAALIMAAELVEPDVDRFSQQDAGGHPVGVGSKGCGGITAVSFAKERHRRWPGSRQISAALFFGEGYGNLHLGHHLLRQPWRPVLNDIRNLFDQVVRVLLRWSAQ